MKEFDVASCLPLFPHEQVYRKLYEGNPSIYHYDEKGRLHGSIDINLSLSRKIVLRQGYFWKILYGKDRSILRYDGEENAFLRETVLRLLGEHEKARKGGNFLMVSYVMTFVAYALTELNQCLAAVGYTDISYFYKLFAKHYGMTPKKYRELEDVVTLR